MMIFTIVVMATVLSLLFLFTITTNVWAVGLTEQDNAALKPLQSLCNNLGTKIDCASIKYAGNDTIVLMGDENIYKQNELVYNPGLWPIVDYFLMTKQMMLNSVIFDESDRNSYRIILSKGLGKNER